MRRIVTHALLCPALAAILAASGPAWASIQVQSGLTVVHQGVPGQMIRGTLRVKNDGSQPASALVYESDYATSAPRNALFPDAGSTPRSSAGWLEVAATAISLGPGEEAEVPYLIRIPDEEALKGSFWSVIHLEDTSTTTRPSDGEQAVGVTFHRRVAVRITTDIGEATAAVAFQRTALERVEGVPTVRLDLENTGERWLPLKASVQLFDDAGKSLGTWTSAPASLYPGSTFQYAVGLTDVPAGRYPALVLADAGTGRAFAARLHLEIP